MVAASGRELVHVPSARIAQEHRPVLDRRWRGDFDGRNEGWFKGKLVSNITNTNELRLLKGSESDCAKV